MVIRLNLTGYARMAGASTWYWALGTEVRLLSANGRWDTPLLSALLPAAAARAPAPAALRAT